MSGCRPHLADGQVVLVDGIETSLRAFFDAGIAWAGVDPGCLPYPI
jgi:hypothetical protein